MKLTARDLMLICITAIITASICIAINCTKKTGEEIIFSFDKSVKKSGHIDWGEGKKLKNEFKGNKYFKTDDPDHPGKYVTLEGFRFDAANIRMIVNSNFEGNIQADELILYFGEKGKTGPDNHGNIHIVAVGAYKNKLLLDVPIDPATGKKKTTAAVDDYCIFDKADPCPPNPVE